jgi:AMMECR1 domain-containing protein
MVVVDIGSLSFLETACWKTGLLETSWLDKKVETLRQSGGESYKGRLLVGEKVAAAIEGAMM